MDPDFHKIHKLNSEEDAAPPHPPQEHATIHQPTEQATSTSIYPSPNTHSSPYRESPRPGKVLSEQNATTASVAEPTIPYLASLTAFVVLIISTFYSLISLIDYALNKLIKTENASSSDYLYSYSGTADNYLVIFTVAAFCVSLPAVILMARVISRYEQSEPWRLAQKWRRGIYAVGAIVLIIGVVGSLTAMTYNILAESIGINDSTPSSYSYPQESTTKDKKDTLSAEQLKANKITKAIVSGLAGSAILGAGLFVLGSNFANRRRSTTWITLGALLVIGGGLSIYNVIQVQSSVADAKKQSGQTTSPAAPSDSSSYDDTTYSNSSYYDNIERVQEDLEYYKSIKGGGYPTKEQWDNGDFKSSGASLSSATYLKTVSYAPSGCNETSCSGYSVTGKNKSGKEETLKNSDSTTNIN